MLKAVAVLSLSFVLAACGSGSGASSAADVTPEGLIPPELQIRQLGGVGSAARHVRGPIPVQLQVAIRNLSSETLTLERLELQSMGAGAYTIESATRPFNKVITSNAVEMVQFFVSASAEDTIMGVNGPVTVRVTAYYNSPLGRFRKIYVQQVNDQLSRPRPPR